MRIPVAKKYRAFPELDRFSDEQAKRYLKESLRSTRPWERRAMFWGGLVVMGTATVAAWIGVGMLAPWMMGPDRTTPPSGASAEAQFLVVTAIRFFAAAMAAFLSGSVFLDACIARLTRRRLEGARCPSCSYSLLGLAVQRDAEGSAPMVLCPECGRRVDVGGIEAELRTLAPVAGDSPEEPAAS